MGPLETPLLAASPAWEAVTLPWPQTQSPSEGNAPVSLSSRAVCSNRSRTSPAVNVGLASSINATTPAVAGLLILVPESLAKSYNAGTIVIAADGGSSYRKEIFPEYKANRKVKYAEQTPQEEKEFAMFMAEFSNTLTLLKEKYPVFQFKGVEADDIAAYITQHLDDYGLDECWMVSSVRDWDFLISDRVSRFSTVTRKEITLDNWDEHYDFDVPDYITFKCLCGD